MEGHSEALNLFTEPVINKGVIGCEIVEHLPISNFEGGLIEFALSTPSFLDLSRSTLYVRCKVVTGDNQDVPVITSDATYDKKGDVTTVNNLFSSLFEKVDFTVQNQNLTSGIPSHTYPYKGMIDTLLSETHDSNRATMFFKDSSVAVNSCSPFRKVSGNPDSSIVDGNPSLKYRAGVINGSREFDMLGPIPIDFATQKRLLLNNTSICLKLWQNQAAFTLLSGATDVHHKIKITDVKLRLCHVTLSPELLLAVNESTKLKPASYHFDSSVIRTQSVARGMQTAVLNDLFTHCPEKLFVVLVASSAYVGNYQSNPFNFQHFNISEIAFYHDNTSLPGKPLQLDFRDTANNSTFLQAYENLKALGAPYMNISYSDFHRGYTILAFDLRTDRTDDLQSARRSGQMRLELRFAEPLAEAVTVLTYAKYKSTLTIDQVRNTQIS